MGNRLLITAPTDEPFLIPDLVQHLRLDDFSLEGASLTQYLKAVRRHVEEIAGIAFLTQTWEWSQDLFPYATTENPFAAFFLPGYPLQSVTSIKYQDINNVQQTLSASVYSVDTRSQPGRVGLAFNQTWPDALWLPNSVIVRYVCGYATLAAIPEDLKQTLLVAAGMLYEYREELIDGNVTKVGLLQRLLAPYRMWA